MDQRHTPDSTQALHEGWDAWMHQQQRYWHEWMEAGQLWLSWWVSTLPPVNWPPAGMVLPPEGGRTSPAPSTGPDAAPEPVIRAPKAAPSRKPRAAAQRHH
ncbi:hypothetical protein [Leptothrix discophora]|uniref:Uncharacterized protein n=1 Tax=Leptothrix discophora TaxID=89 RepID=A0ABT9G282_LEPDI|nr:hypothetical protein [Leptothrix discophora]MDP4300563.1 hypothetical protein [Leptothrix discophora]